MNKDEKGKLFHFFANESKKLNNYVHRKIQSINDMDAEDIVSDVILNLFNKPDIIAHIENLAAEENKIQYYCQTSSSNACILHMTSLNLLNISNYIISTVIA